MVIDRPSDLSFPSSSDDSKKLNYLKTGSITHGSELSFMEFLDLFKSFSLRLRKDIRTLFANHSVCNKSAALSPEEQMMVPMRTTSGGASVVDNRRGRLCKCTNTVQSTTEREEREKR